MVAGNIASANGRPECLEPRGYSEQRSPGVLDTQALEQFLAGVERRAFHRARLAVGSRDDALDVVQDAMLKLAERYAHREPSEWGPLFQQILHSRIMDWHRKSRVRNRWRVWLGKSNEADAPDPIENQPAAAAANPDRGVADERMTGALEAALRMLAPRQQQAFLLRVWEGLDVGETATAMGCSQGSVKTHYSRAVHALRAALSDHYD